MIVFMETWNTHITLVTHVALYFKCLVQVQAGVLCVHVSLDLRVRWHGHAAGRTHVLAFPLCSQLFHASGINPRHCFLVAF